jgi:TRAP-type C4-dicarboxylate transport system permease small subunit
LELTELLMVMVIFAALPLVSLKGEHVVFDSLDAFLPAWVRKIQQGLIHIVSAALLFGLAYLMWQTGGEFAVTGETTAQLKITKAPFIHGMGLLCGLAGLVHLAKAFLPNDENASEGGTL